MYLFFDTETTGLPLRYDAPMSDVNNFPRVIQLAWALYDANEQLISSRVDLIKPEGWFVPNQDFWIRNGFTTERNKELGVPINDALAAFINMIEVSEFLIAHNMQFDYPIIGAEMIRASMSASKKLPRFCTMKSTIGICKVPYKSGGNGFKFPKLEELYRFLFREEMQGAHDALNDVNACAKCFFELKFRNLISLAIK